MSVRGSRLPRFVSVLLTVALVVSGVEAVTVAVAGRVAPAAADPATTDVTEAATRFLAAQYAQAQGHKVEVTSERTQSTSTFADPDGSWTLQAATQPVRALVNGVWQPVDPTLVSDSGGVHPKVSAEAMTFSGGGGTALASLSGDGSQAGLKWLANLPAPTLSGASATYPNVASGVDLVLTASRVGFEVSIVLKTRPANPKAVYRLPLTAKGLSASGPDGSGLITLSDAKGRSAGFVRPTVMFDAQSDASTGAPSHTGPIATTVVTNGAAQELDFTPQAGFLSDPATVFPVTIDPSVHLGQLNDMWVGSAGASGSGSTELRVGYYNGDSQTDRSFLRFDTSTLTGTTVSAATLALYQWHTPAGCAAKESRVYGLAGAFTDSTTWSTQPTAYPTVEASSTAVYGATGCNPWWNSYNVTGLAQKWANGSEPNYGMLLRQGVETDHAGWWRFYGMDYSVTSQLPSLAVTYNTPPGDPDEPGDQPAGRLRDRRGPAIDQHGHAAVVRQRHRP